jgi:hypothetical protein
MAMSKTVKSSSDVATPDFAKTSLGEALKKLGTSMEDLSVEEARQRLQHYGLTLILDLHTETTLKRWVWLVGQNGSSGD